MPPRKGVSLWVKRPACLILRRLDLFIGSRGENGATSRSHQLPALKLPFYLSPPDYGWVEGERPHQRLVSAPLPAAHLCPCVPTHCLSMCPCLMPTCAHVSPPTAYLCVPACCPPMPVCPCLLPTCVPLPAAHLCSCVSAHCLSVCPCLLPTCAHVHLPAACVPLPAACVPPPTAHLCPCAPACCHLCPCAPAYCPALGLSTPVYCPVLGSWVCLAWGPRSPHWSLQVTIRVWDEGSPGLPTMNSTLTCPWLQPHPSLILVTYDTHRVKTQSVTQVKIGRDLGSMYPMGSQCGFQEPYGFHRGTSRINKGNWPSFPFRCF